MNVGKLIVAGQPAPTGPGVSPLYHLGQAEESLRKAAELSLAGGRPAGQVARILGLLTRVTSLRVGME